MGDAGRGPREEPGARDERITPGQLRPGRAPRSAAQSGARRWLAALAAVAVVAGGVALAGELTSGNGPATAALPSPLSGLPVRPAADPPAFAGVLQSRTSARQWIKLFSPVTGRVVRSVAAGGGGRAQPATMCGEVSGMEGMPETVTRGLTSVGCACPACEQSTVAP